MTTRHTNDVERLGRALRHDLDTLAARAGVPSSAAVWLRAERRARQDALKQAERPIWFAERMALVGAGVGIGWFGTFAQDWLRTHDLLSAFSALGSAELLAIGGVSLTLGTTALAGLGLAVGVFALRSAE